MSRSAFAVRFRAQVGQPPLDYLIAWRMHGAAYEPRTTVRSVACIGAAVGYPAGTTVSSTFRRVLGQPPGRYRHEERNTGWVALAAMRSQRSTSAVPRLNEPLICQAISCSPRGGSSRRSPRPRRSCGSRDRF